MMYSIASGFLGWFHVASAVVAMCTGAYILLSVKGTQKHKTVGYIYVVAMVLTCSTALGIYNLTGFFGVFHILALIGFVTLLAGLSPLFIPTSQMKYRVFHLWFMYYSVLGLYAAFASELSVRLPKQPFYIMVGITTGTIFFFGTIFIFWKEKQWAKHFDIASRPPN